MLCLPSRIPPTHRIPFEGIARFVPSILPPAINVQLFQVISHHKLIPHPSFCLQVRHSLCMDYVEVRNGTDFANTGMRSVMCQFHFHIPCLPSIPSPICSFLPVIVAMALRIHLSIPLPVICSSCSAHSIAVAEVSKRVHGPFSQPMATDW